MTEVPLLRFPTPEDVGTKGTVVSGRRVGPDVHGQTGVVVTLDKTSLPSETDVSVGARVLGCVSSGETPEDRG